ncbi:MAG: DNA repair protein RecN [Anaerovoracaceae bacterium]|jgi:DNA repair protein RecN (Recombination protein N)
MLTHIAIKDFAIIDNISLDLHQGFHVLTGETGAGKSIIIEAISMALGSRADTTYVRSGKEKAVIELIAEPDNPAVLSMLAENGLGEDKTLYILREIYAEGKSICRVNGTLVSVSFLNNLCRKIADIHGQYDHQSLLDPDSHLILLDEYAKADIEPVKSEVSQLYEKYSRLETERKAILDAQAENMRNRDFMQYEFNEISEANPKIGEDEALAEQLVLLQNSEAIYSTLSQVYELLYEQSPSSQDSLGRSLKLLEEISGFSKEYANLSETVSDCYYKLDDLRGELRRAKDSISFSPEVINETMERIDLLDRMKKKYGGTIESVLSYKEQIEKKLSQIENSDQLLESLTKDAALCREQLHAASKKLTVLRENAARKMEADMAKELEELNFKDTSLIVSITPLGDGDKAVYTASGSDRVEFLIVTNKGETPKPLSKIASGGEISRIMLAFKSILGDYDNIPTLIFDEIDSGISGVTASIVGRKMKKIASGHQVLCITHLAQIAAFSDHHYRISKEESQGRTITTIKPLDQNEKIREIARLLGGLHVTETTLKNAEELIAEAAG